MVLSNDTPNKSLVCDASPKSGLRPTTQALGLKKET
jgi:hypothetical protein